MRLGLAFGAVYYYNTSPIFADEAICTSQLLGVNR
jgi:intermembrane space import and assembly protein 40